MYGHQENTRNSKNQRWTVTDDLANILALYFPQIDISLEASKFKLQLASELVRFFSAPIGQTIVSQVYLILSTQYALKLKKTEWERNSDRFRAI